MRETRKHEGGSDGRGGLALLNSMANTARRNLGLHSTTAGGVGVVYSLHAGR